MNLKKTLLIAAAMLTGMAATAQTEAEQEALELGYKPYPYNFVQLQGGVGTTFTNVSFTDLISPTASIGIGRFFTPAVGARLHFNAWESKGGFKSISDTYKFNYLNSNLDLLVNLNNIFSSRRNHLLNVILVGGVGLNYAWGNDDLAAIIHRTANLPAESTINAWGPGLSRDHLWSHNLRAGILLDFNLAKNFNLGLEVDMNSLDDRFNSKYLDCDDWMMTAQLTLTFKFGHKKADAPKQAVIREEPPVVIEEKPEPQQIVEEKPVVTEPVVQEEPLKETIFYKIRETDTNRDAVLNRVAEWAKKYPNKTVTVSGYADKGTGTSALNSKYAQQRADKVAEELKEKGVSANQLSTHSYGDTVQPFAENDKNRCVIIEGK